MLDEIFRHSWISIYRIINVKGNIEYHSCATLHLCEICAMLFNTAPKFPKFCVRQVSTVVKVLVQLRHHAKISG